MNSKNNKIRYAVVGLGYIAQAAVLPAFENAKKNSVLAALVSDDHEKLNRLGDKYEVENRYSYEHYDECIRNENIDAVYIALPNNMHCEYTVRAAQAGKHVLCEKPMAVTVDECQEMIDVCRENGVRLMIAYRLHFEKANLQAIEIAASGRIGEPRIFNSVFTMQVEEGNIRLRREMGGGTLYDIGIYCINAARNIFRSEPAEVVAFSASNGEHRFHDVDEMTTAVLRFPGERLASFTTSFGASDVSQYQIVGTKGDLRVDPAYEFADKLQHYLSIDGKTTKKGFSKRDQFGPEIVYFSKCILDDVNPEPSGFEGLADIRIIRALYQSAQTGQIVRIASMPEKERPSSDQEIKKPAVDKPELIHAKSPSGEK